MSLSQIFSSDLAFVVDGFFSFCSNVDFSQKTWYFALWKCFDSVRISWSLYLKAKTTTTFEELPTDIYKRQSAILFLQ